jgi:putative acetyltransferase
MLATRTPLTISTAHSFKDLEQIRILMREYAITLEVNLCFQGFDAELAELPGDYAAPMGTMLLAHQGIAVAGCCALRPLTHHDYANACEMKRLYVRPAYRSHGVGRHLVQAILDTARANGYQHMLLDTLDDMHSARALYAQLGFVEIAPYYHNPIAGAHYLKLDLP